MNLRRSLPLALAPLLLIAAACGDDGNDAASTSEPAAGAATTLVGAEATEADAGTTAAPATTSEETTATTSAETTATTSAETTATTSGETTATTSGETTAMTSEETTATTGGARTGPATASTGGTGTTTASTGSAPAAGGAITVGSADFSESQLLAEIYGQALAAAGFDVDYELAIGARELYYGAAASGEVDLVPEYTNSLLSFVLRQSDPNAQPEATNVDEQVAELGEVLPPELTVLTPSTAEDKDVIVCTAEAAEEYDLGTLSDLAAVLDQITLGAPPEFEGRSPFGLVGFTELLGAPPIGEFVPLDVSAVADALAAGQIDCGNLFSTLPVITTEGFVALEDDQGLVPNEAVLPLVRTEVVDDELTAALDEVDAALDTDVLKELMVDVEVDARSPQEVAAEWLATLG